MSMAIAKKYTWSVIVVLVVLMGILYFFNRFNHDVKALTDFSYSYEKFDNAISDFSKSVFASNLNDTLAADDLERKANEALIELNIKASERISSLIKNDAEFMSSELEIADLSGKELTAIGIYKRSIFIKSAAEMDNLAKEFRDLKNKRTTTYARFQELVKQTK